MQGGLVHVGAGWSLDMTGIGWHTAYSVSITPEGVVVMVPLPGADEDRARAKSRRDVSRPGESSG